MPNVLVVDDEESIQKLVAYSFESQGFHVQVEANGRTAFQRLRDNGERFDICILDWMLPDMDGLEICKALRQEAIDIPIILLTAKDDVVDRILGLELGADDYVTKPFSPRELVARARTVLRRVDVAKPQTETPRMLVVGDLVMDVGRHEVTRAGTEISLTPKEFELLQYLMEHKGIVLSRDRLLSHVWGFADAGDTRIVDVHVSHLREKIEHDPKHPIFLRTVRGVGYRMSDDAVRGTSNRQS